MPYITEDKREVLKPELEQLAKKLVEMSPEFDPGLFNFAVTKLLVEMKLKPSYRTYNSVIGALECIKQEYYRRVISDYEDEKSRLNGDVY